MGAGIAQVAAQAGHRVLLADAQQGAVERALTGIAADLQSLAARGRLAASGRRCREGSHPAGTDRRASADAASWWKRSSRTRQPSARCCTGSKTSSLTTRSSRRNTSSLSITAMAAGLKRPERVVGMHFFNPRDADETGRGRQRARDLARRRRDGLRDRARPGARSRRSRNPRPDSSSTASRGRSTARPGARTPRAPPTRRRSTRSCATAAAFRWVRSS